MFRWQTMVGIVLGLLLAAGILSLWRSHQSSASGPMIPDYGGPLKTITMQYTKDAQFTWPIYRAFLGQQSAALTVQVICPEPADYDELLAQLGPVPPQLQPLYTHHTQTPWSRDRWVLLAGTPERLPTVLAPRGEYQQEVWAQRAGDARVAEDIARALPTRYAFRRSTLYFDAGDFLADGAYVFVAPAVVRRNVQHTVETRADLLRALTLDLQREPVLLDAAPDHHVGMFMMSAGAQTIVVADPSLAQSVFTPDGAAAAGLAGGADFSAATQQRFDAVATVVRDKGFRVVRMPVVPARDDNKVYLTYVNVMLDLRAGQRIVYMPSYAGQERMNAAARKVWETLGYTVRQIDCTGAFMRGGTLHCLVNVLERASP